MTFLEILDADLYITGYSVSVLCLEHFTALLQEVPLAGDLFKGHRIR
jgi:hypothetical protein